LINGDYNSNFIDDYPPSSLVVCYTRFSEHNNGGLRVVAGKCFATNLSKLIDDFVGDEEVSSSVLISSLEQAE